MHRARGKRTAWAVIKVQRTYACADKIPGLAECPPKDLKIEEEWGTLVLNMRLFLLLLLKDPDTQMTCNTPKMLPHFGCNISQ